jgi:hypothetical protein
MSSHSRFVPSLPIPATLLVLLADKQLSLLPLPNLRYPPGLSLFESLLAEKLTLRPPC